VRIEKLRETFDVDVKMVHFPLHPETPAEGVTLESLFAGRDIDLDASYNRMKGLMDTEGLDYGRRTHTYNSRLAQELGKWADTQDGGAKFHDSLYRSYFVDGRNIGDADTLVAIVKEIGLSSANARNALDERTFQAAIDEDWSHSNNMGVTGVPTYAAGGYGVVGAQPYEVLVQLMEQAGAAQRSA